MLFSMNPCCKSPCTTTSRRPILCSPPSYSAQHCSRPPVLPLFQLQNKQHGLLNPWHKLCLTHNYCCIRRQQLGLTPAMTLSTVNNQQPRGHATCEQNLLLYPVLPPPCNSLRCPDKTIILSDAQKPEIAVQCLNLTLQCSN